MGGRHAQVALSAMQPCTAIHLTIRRLAEAILLFFLTVPMNVRTLPVHLWFHLLLTHTYVRCVVAVLAFLPCRSSRKVIIMAEVVGIAAGSVGFATLAAQVAKRVVKLKSYWEEMKDVPEDIEDLLEQLHIFSEILDDIKNDQKQNPISPLLLDSTSTLRCLTLCKQAVERLQGLVDELFSDIQKRNKMKRTWASAKVILGKDKLERYKKKLERAVSLLSLSQQSYTRYPSQVSLKSTLISSVPTIENNEFSPFNPYRQLMSGSPISPPYVFVSYFPAPARNFISSDRPLLLQQTPLFLCRQVIHNRVLKFIGNL